MTVERLSKYFDNIWCSGIMANLETLNNIIYNCDQYKFKNYKGVVPQKLIINAAVEHIYFDDAVNEVHIPEVVMEEKANLKSIIKNKYGDKDYSLLPHVQTMVIRNNPKVLCDLMDYINGKYIKYQINNEIHDHFRLMNRINRMNSIRTLSSFSSNFSDDSHFSHSIFDYDNDDDIWDLCKLNKKMNIVIERPGIAFGTVRKISNYFTDVLVNNNKPEEYLAKQESYQKLF